VNQHLSPVEIICGIDSMQGGGAPDIEIIRSLARIAEESARNILKRGGYAPDLMTYCYVPSDDLTPTEIRKERLEFESAAWHNEASHLIGIPDEETEAAAFTIIEAGQLSYFLETGQTQKAIISMANLLACGLLHSDQNKEKAIAILRNRHSKQSANGGAGKAGYEKPIKQYIRVAYKSLELDLCSPNIAARRIFRQFDDDNGVTLYEEAWESDDPCPIVSNKYDRDKQTLFYYATSNPEKEESLNFRRLEDIVREIRGKAHPKIKKPE